MVGRSGRGPTKLISPRSTLKICGISSIRILRMMPPMKVTRGSLTEAQRATPSFSASTRMLRNLITENFRPFSPTRSCR